MSAREIQDQKATAREMLVQHAHADAEVSASAVQGDAISSPVTRVDAANLTRVVRQLEVIAKRQATRIAFKAGSRILFLDLAEIVAVQAEGNYVSLRHRATAYLLRESLSSMAEKLKPYGFIRIHRSVVVNISAVEEMQSLPTGVYRLRVKGGKDYFVTHSYKDNLRDLAELWLGLERLCD